jgi:SAM-dependent methyltransferase
MSGTPEVSTDQASQDFWLDHLQESQGFTDWVFQRIEKYLGQSIIEIGCGLGTYTLPMARQGRHIVALDLHQPYVDQLRQRLGDATNVEALQGDALTVDLDRHAPVDTVVLLDVLEHLGDEQAMLRRAHSWLRPGGRLIVKVPAGPWLFSSMDKAIGHHRRYDRTAIQAALRRAGFALEHLEYFNSVAAFGWWLNGNVMKRATPPGGQLDLFDRLVPVLRLIDIATRRLFGLSLIAVGRVQS